MSHFLIRAALTLMTGAALTFSSGAFADEPAQDEAVFSVQASDTELSESRGAFLPESLNLGTAELSAQDAHNVVIGGITGNNAIGSGSLVNTNGIVNVIQNSGNNVIIQSSTIVNMTFEK